MMERNPTTNLPDLQHQISKATVEWWAHDLADSVGDGSVEYTLAVLLVAARRQSETRAFRLFREAYRASVDTLMEKYREDFPDDPRGWEA